MKLPAIPMRGAANPCFENGCTACCHDNEMVLTEADIARIRLARPGVDFYFEADDGLLQLRTVTTADVSPEQGRNPLACIFLAPNGSCSIHEDRPAGCRLYPAIWDADARKAILDTVYCPHTDGFVLAPSTSDALKRLVSRLEAERRARQPLRSD